MLNNLRQRIYLDDGRFYDTLTVPIPAKALQLIDIEPENAQVKLKDIAHYRYVKACERGESNPVIVTYLLPEKDSPVTHLFPGLDNIADDEEHILSASSFISLTMRTLFKRGWICFANGVWQINTPSSAKIWQRRATAVLHYLTTHNHIHLETKRDHDLDFSEIKIVVDQDLVPVGAGGFISSFVQRERPFLAFNTAYFLLEHDDIFMRHLALGDAHSFGMAKGIINRPPVFQRASLLQDINGHWQITYISMTDINLTLPSGIRLTHQSRPLPANTLPFAINPAEPTGVTIYTRYFGVESHGQVLGKTPGDNGRLECTIIDRRIVGWKRGGNLTLPHNGFVLSFAPNALPARTAQTFLDSLLNDFWVTYEFADERYQTIRQGLQTGPLLLSNGRCPLDNNFLAQQEQFWPSRFLENGQYKIGVVPTNYKRDVDTSRAGRVGVGIDKNGDLIVILVAGVNSGMGVPGVDSAGATLIEIAELLRKAGSLSAVNMDGGGSTQAFVMGGQAIIPGDRRGLPGLHYERMVPAIGVAQIG